MAEHHGGVGPDLGCRAGADVLRLLHRQVDQIARVELRLPAREQVVEADADRHSAIDARHGQYRLDHLAAMRVRAIGTGKDHQLWSIERRGTRSCSMAW